MERKATHTAVEASELDFPPGRWPDAVTYEGVRYERGRPEYRDGDLVSIDYINHSTRARLTVYND